jgi:hypothetical protein
VDAASIGTVLAAVSSGAGGAVGNQLWTGICALVRRPLREGHHDPDVAVPARDGSAELAALEQAPGDNERALALAEALLARAAADTGFRQDLERWRESARQVIVQGSVSNTVTGGVFHGPVMQGGNFTGLSFGGTAEQRDDSDDGGRDA